MLMGVGGWLLATDAVGATGPAGEAWVVDAVSRIPGQSVTRVAAVPTASTVAAAAAIVSGAGLRAKPRREAALPPGLGRSGRLSMDVQGLVG